MLSGQRWWQRCQWEVTGNTYTPPRSFDFGGGIAPTWLEDLVYGFTTLMLRCVLCGDVKTRVETGKVDL